MTGQLSVTEEQDRYDLKTDQGYYIKSRSFIGSSTWLMGPNVVVFVEYLIAKASRSPWKFPCTFQKKEIWIQRGEVCCSISRMVDEIKILTRQQIRDALEKLKWSHFLEDLTPPCVKGTRSYKHLRLCKYSDYQDPKNYENQLRTNSEPIKNHTGTTIEEYKEYKKEKKYIRDLDRFDEFWALYPKKVSKGQAERAWKSIPSETRDVIITILPQYKFGSTFIKNPSTWLNARCWEDKEITHKATTFDPNDSGIARLMRSKS